MLWIIVSVALKKWYVSFDAQCRWNVAHFYETRKPIPCSSPASPKNELCPTWKPFPAISTTTEGKPLVVPFSTGVAVNVAPVAPLLKVLVWPRSISPLWTWRATLAITPDPQGDRTTWKISRCQRRPILLVAHAYKFIFMLGGFWQLLEEVHLIGKTLWRSLQQTVGESSQGKTNFWLWIDENRFKYKWVLTALEKEKTVRVGIGVRDQFRLGGWRRLPEYFVYCLPENQVVLPEYYMFLPENSYLNNSTLPDEPRITK